MIANWIPYAALMVASVSLFMAVATFIRAGDWEKSKAGEAIRSELGAVKNRVTVIETKVSDLPTKADIARLTAEVDAVRDGVKLVQGGVGRIEGYLMEHGK